MEFPLFTGAAARFLRTSEPRLAELVRRGRIRPAPPIVGGRRLWGADHVYEAARNLGLLSLEVRQILEPLLADRKATTR